jgi:signal transduction histidine kinase
MHPAILPAALAFSTSGAMAAYVARRREKSDVHWLLLALLIALMTWTGGSLARFSVSSEAGLLASLRVVLLGVFATPPLWLLLAARSLPVPWLWRRRLRSLVFAPSLLAYLALLTNDGHHLVIRRISFEALEAGGRAWAGPLFWAFIAWGYGCVAGGLAIYLFTARRMVARPGDRGRGLALGLAAAIPLVVSSLYLFRLVPIRFDLTPAALVVSVALISAAVFRFHLLEGIPLARRDVIEYLQDGVLIASGEGVLLDLNPAAAAILREDTAALRRERLAVCLARLVHGTGGSALRDALVHLDERREPIVGEVATPDGRRVEIRAACVRDGQGEPVGQFAVLRDRSAERRHERRARQNERLETVATLAAGVAHEVNNPLAFIRSNLAQIHRMGELVEASLERGEAKLARELADLPQIVAETLDGIARIERIVAGMRRLSARREEIFLAVDLNDVVADAIRLANLRGDPQVCVETALAERLPPVDGSPERLAQALINLLVNARQAVAGGVRPRIRIETRHEGAAVSVCVRDNGPGIAPELLPRIFDPFFTTKSPDEGTGLGLTIAYDIVRDHGGVLEVESEVGAGTAFHARLPVR